MFSSLITEVVCDETSFGVVRVPLDVAEAECESMPPLQFEEYLTSFPLSFRNARADTCESINRTLAVRLQQNVIALLYQLPL